MDKKYGIDFEENIHADEEEQEVFVLEGEEDETKQD